MSTLQFSNPKYFEEKKFLVYLGQLSEKISVTDRNFLSKAFKIELYVSGGTFYFEKFFKNIYKFFRTVSEKFWDFG